MPLHHLTLTGCSPTPLAHYLKGLGILRLVAEQADPTARGWWQDEAFHLATALDRPALERFFLEEYQPTPMLNPWNGGSGFYDKKDSPLSPIQKSRSERLASFQAAIAHHRMELGARHRKPDKKDKTRIIQRLKVNTPPTLRRWLDAVTVIASDGKDRYPSLTGTGGNDGNLDFTDGFMRRLGEAFALEDMVPSENSSAWLKTALFAEISAQLPQGKSPGQFLPGRQGGANSTNGPKGSNSLNPWDSILMMEGLIVFTVSLVSRSRIRGENSLSAPFATEHTRAGGISTGTEENHGEQWMPLWRTASSFGDIQRLFTEGRVKNQRSSERRPVDFIRALARAGVAKGIDEFVRFGFMKRLGGMYFQAVPLGRWQVEPQPQQDLLNDLDRALWLDRMQRAARDKFAPNSFAVTQRNLESAIMEVCAHGAATVSWQALLLAISQMEVQLIRSHVFTKKQRLRPIPPLSAGWLTAADDGSPEFRLAVALALQAADSAGQDPIRSHWLPLDPEKLKRRTAEFATDATGLRKDPRIVCHDLDPMRDLLALVQRRAIEAAHAASGHLPLAGVPCFCAHPADLAALIEGQVDLRKITRLAQAFMAIDRRTLSSARPLAAPTSSAKPPPLYGLFRLATLPWPLRCGGADIPIRFDPAILTRLAAGDLRSAGDLALRRLRASGLTPVLRRLAGEPALARRIALSLAFPISPATASALAATLTKPQSATKQS